MSDFSRQGQWTLVNRFTIEWDETPSGGRQLMLTSVPKQVFVELSDLRAYPAYEWNSSEGVEDFDLDEEGDVVRQQKPRESYGHNPDPRIEFQGELSDRIIIFSMDEGKISRHDKADLIQVRPLGASRIGGVHNADTEDGNARSGWSSRQVEEDGLMNGEPGSIYLIEPDVTLSDRHGLMMELYMEEVAFNALLGQILSAAPGAITGGQLRVVAELFEDEVSAALSDHTMRRDYGILKRSEGAMPTARARLGRIELTYHGGITTSPVRGEQDPEGETGSRGHPQGAAMSPVGMLDLARLTRRIGWTNILLVLLILSVFLVG